MHQNSCLARRSIDAVPRLATRKSLKIRTKTKSDEERSNWIEKRMKVLFTGGVKSGKSRHAEKYCLNLAQEETPIYLATTEILDEGMNKRISFHQERRGNQFITVEEPLALARTIQRYSAPVLIECLTMWINNMLYHQKEESMIMQEINSLFQLPNPMVFVLNEVGLGVLPENELARAFIDISGNFSQLLGSLCDEVYFCVAGQKWKVK